MLLLYVFEKGKRKKNTIPNIQRAERDIYERINELETLKSRTHGHSHSIDNATKNNLNSVLRMYIDNIENNIDTVEEPAFILDRAEGLIDNMINVYQLERIPALDNFDINEYRHNDTEKRKAKVTKEVKKKSPVTTKQHTIKTFNEKSKTHTSDSQNVHDSGLTADLARSYKNITDNSSDNYLSDDIPDIVNFVLNNEDLSADQKDKALRTVQKMQGGLCIVALNDTEDSILLNTWNRSHHPSNINNALNIRKAISVQLADCFEHNKLICGSGRVARVIGSLVTLDSDPSVGSLLTKEAYRNELFNLASESLDKTIKKYAESGDPQMIKYSKTFTDPMGFNNDNEETPDHIVKSFRCSVMEPITEYISKNKTHLKPNIIDEVKAGLDI